MSENKEIIINGEKIPKELVEIILKRFKNGIKKREK